MWITDEALSAWKTIAPGHTARKLREFVKSSAPVTHPSGNKRYNNYIFRVKGNKVLGVSLLERTSTRSANVVNSNLCTFCNGRGYTIMHDDFTSLDVKVKCHVCN